MFITLRPQVKDLAIEIVIASSKKMMMSSCITIRWRSIATMTTAWWFRLTTWLTTPAPLKTSSSQTLDIEASWELLQVGRETWSSWTVQMPHRLRSCHLEKRRSRARRDTTLRTVECKSRGFQTHKRDRKCLTTGATSPINLSITRPRHMTRQTISSFLRIICKPGRFYWRVRLQISHRAWPAARESWKLSIS